jgi:hypothetical protein
MLEMDLVTRSESGIAFRAGMRMLYKYNGRTDKHKSEPGMLTVKNEPSWTIKIPKKTTQFKIVAHCAPKCTQSIPLEGISLFNVIPHSVGNRK